MLFGKKKREDLSDDRIQVDTRTITTLVGQDTVVTGGLSTKSSVRINGTVIGDVRAGGVVILTKTGHIEGTIEAESIIVAGRIDGNMSIRDKVNVEATGKIYGDIITKKFVIDEESIFQGNCIMNRDGKVIPVPPYKKDSDEEEKSEKKSKKSEDKDAKSEDKDAKSDKEELVKKDSDKKNEDKNTSEEKTSEDKADEKQEKSDEKSETADEKKDSEAGSDDKDDANSVSIKIAHIDDVESVDDIPDNDDVIKPKNNNYIKKSKSLSVEIENQ